MALYEAIKAITKDDGQTDKTKTKKQVVCRDGDR